MNLLIVDDDQGLALLLKMELEDQGHRVDTASNGFDGRDLSQKNRYDIIILDLMLPGMNGRQVCQDLRKNHISTPVMIMSALDSPDEKKACISAGASDFMAKPFLFEDFYHTILRLDRGYRYNANENGSSV
ncbi:MAG: response regulator transcription factor [Bacteroidales bacterium]